MADNSAEELDVLQRTFEVLISMSLSCRPRHGYAIARWVGDVSDDVLRVEKRRARCAAAVSKVLAVG